MGQNSPSFEYVQQVLHYWAVVKLQYWMDHVFLSWQWWLLVALLILPWIVWWKVIDKSRLLELFLVAFFVFLIAFIFDEMGTEIGLWEYRYRTTPFMHVFIPYNFTVLPVTYSLMYQRFSTWKSYIKGFVVLSFLFSFVAEPTLEWINIYEPYEWEHIYSFPGYIILALFVRFVVRKILCIHNKALENKKK
jgi:hypothetical protein